MIWLNLYHGFAFFIHIGILYFVNIRKLLMVRMLVFSLYFSNRRTSVKSGNASLAMSSLPAPQIIVFLRMLNLISPMALIDATGISIGL